MNIRCGHCGKYHQSVADVFACSQSGDVPAVAERSDANLVLDIPLPTVQDYQFLRNTLRDVTEGFYETPDGVIYKVVRAVHGSGHLYAKRLYHVVDDNGDTRGQFNIERGAIRRLRPEWKLSRERAVELGKLYGFCIRCGAILTDETSIAQGMGPICAGRWS